MTVLIVLTVISIAGIGAIFWMLKSEQEAEGVTSVLNKAVPISPAPTPKTPLSAKKAPEKPAAKETKTTSSLFKRISKVKLKRDKPHTELSAPPGSKSLIKKLLSKLKLGKTEDDLDDIPEVSHLPSFANLMQETKEKGKREAPGAKEPPTGTASITTSSPEKPSDEEAVSSEVEQSIAKEIELTTQLNELKDKYAKMEVLFKEKSAELEQAKLSLYNELKTRKEFNKVKDLLEKEIKDSKDKVRSIQIERDGAQTEGENLRKRITLLEDKITKLQKDLLEKEDKINELVKRLQTFASPATASTPPVAEPPKAEPNKEDAGPVPAAPKPPEAVQPAPEIEPEPPKMAESAGEETLPEPPQPQQAAQPDGPSDVPEQDTDTEEQPQEVEFLKLQPDIISAPTKKAEPEKPAGQPVKIETPQDSKPPAAADAPTEQSEPPAEKPGTPASDAKPQTSDQTNNNNQKE